jgi:hypothetical protein
MPLILTRLSARRACRVERLPDHALLQRGILPGENELPVAFQILRLFRRRTPHEIIESMDVGALQSRTREDIPVVAMHCEDRTERRREMRFLPRTHGGGISEQDGVVIRQAWHDQEDRGRRVVTDRSAGRMLSSGACDHACGSILQSAARRYPQAL